ncbi:hypothetical protein At1D1609_50940 [Agrobacterium tumefaciens]|uniref:Uncharacterized protein n=1 Tax=Agrobacterium tumefaciens TaxID=358 RepID=A0A2L2LLA7_AGRTU|nr:hypothetical protein At1D1609_50940 [Agrobacterium tumefaciens]
MNLGGPDAPFGMEETVRRSSARFWRSVASQGFSISTATEALFHGEDFADASISLKDEGRSFAANSYNPRRVVRPL